MIKYETNFSKFAVNLKILISQFDILDKEESNHENQKLVKFMYIILVQLLLITYFVYVIQNHYKMFIACLRMKQMNLKIILIVKKNFLQKYNILEKKLNKYDQSSPEKFVKIFEIF